MGRATLLLLLALAACGERASPDAASDADKRRAPDLARPATEVTDPATPVRIGEAGPAFRACQAAGTPRGDAALTVRAGPFDATAISGAVPPGARFFVCTRSIDQRWLGIVYEPGGALNPACGVSAPVPARTRYAGPCRSGWVASAAVRTVAA